MAKREAKEVALTIESTVFPGIGVGSSEGRTFHVKGAFPGQTVRGIHAKNKRRIGLLRSFEVIERSKGEKEPSCVHYENCGGVHFAGIAHGASKTIEGSGGVQAL